jgi:hypothetical protein
VGTDLPPPCCGREVIAHRHRSPDNAALSSCPLFVFASPTRVTTRPRVGVRKRNSVKSMEGVGIDRVIVGEVGVKKSLIDSQPLAWF